MSAKDVFETRNYKRDFEVSSNRIQWKISITVVTTIAWLTFSLYWIAFIWEKYNAFQNIILLIIFFLVFSAVNALLWIFK